MQGPKLCVTVTAATTAELRERRDRVRGADLVELRLDAVRDPSAAGALSGRRLPVIVTCRAAWEGGSFRGSEDERRALLREAQALGAEFIDVEWRAGFDDLIAARAGQGVILSMHDFDGVPPDLPARFAEMQRAGAEVVKLAVTATRLTDCLALGALTDGTRTPAVVIAMGNAGLATRILPGRFGSAWTYAGDAAAAGQLPPRLLLDQFRFRAITDRTALYGVVGRPVHHSISPAIHNAAFAASALDAVYLPLAAADFDDFLSFASALAIEGASVTAPFKLPAFECAAAADAVTARIGAANTLRRGPHGWLARNTDGAGFLEPLRERMDVRDTRVTVLGAGGAARAVGEALAGAGAQVTFCARRRDRADAVAAAAGGLAGVWPPPGGSWDLLVNATPVGTFPEAEETPLPEALLTGGLVYDLVYNPPDTRLLREARAAGCDTIGGLDMLIAQARQQFEWWTGLGPCGEVMHEAALGALAGSARRERNRGERRERRGVSHGL